MWMCLVFFSCLMAHALFVCVFVTSRLHSACLCVFDQRTSKPEESTAQTILFGPRGTEARYCVKQSGVKTHKSIPRCFPTVCFAVGEINNCGLRSGFSSLSWPFHLSSSYCTVVYSTPQKTDSSSTIFGFRHFSCLSCADSESHVASLDWFCSLIDLLVPLLLCSFEMKFCRHFHLQNMFSNVLSCTLCEIIPLLHCV